MLADLQTIISDKQSLIHAVGTVVGTNVLDLGVTGSIPQGGSPIYDLGRSYNAKGIHVQITTAVAASGGASTVDFQICSSANSDLSTPTLLDTSTPISKTLLVAGFIVPVGFAMPFGITQRYLGTNYVIATNDVTAGVVQAQLATTRQTNPSVTS